MDHNSHRLSGIALNKLKQLIKFLLVAIISNIDPCLFVPLDGIQEEKRWPNNEKAAQSGGFGCWRGDTINYTTTIPPNHS